MALTGSSLLLQKYAYSPCEGWGPLDSRLSKGLRDILECISLLRLLAAGSADYHFEPKVWDLGREICDLTNYQCQLGPRTWGL